MSTLEPTERFVVAPKKSRRRKTGFTGIVPEGQRYKGEYKETCLKVYESLQIETRESQKKLLAEMAETMEAAYAKQERNRKEEAEGVEIDPALKSCTFFIGQAPVGTGKTYVLLLLAFVSFWLYGKKSVVSTQTKVLQNQLLKKDIPVFKKLLTAISGENGIVDDQYLSQWTFHMVKGRGNYLCPYQVSRYLDATRDGKEVVMQDRDNKTVRISYHQLTAINGGDNGIDGNGRTESLDLDRYSQIGNWSEDILSLISAEKDNCLTDACSYFPMGCPYYNAKYMDSPLIICNHNVLKSILRPDLDMTPVNNPMASEKHDLSEYIEEYSYSVNNAVSDNIIEEFNSVEAQIGKICKQRKLVSPISKADNFFIDEAHHFMGYYCGERVRCDLSNDIVHSRVHAPVFCFKTELESKEMKNIHSTQKEIMKQWEVVCKAGTALSKISRVDFPSQMLQVNQVEQSLAVLLALCDKLREEYAKFSSEKTEVAINKLDEFVSDLTDMKRDIENTPIDVYCGYRNEYLTPTVGETPEDIVFDYTDDGYKSSWFEKSPLSNDINKNFPNAAFAGFISGTLLINDSADVYRAECGLPECKVVKVDSPFDYRRTVLWVPKADSEAVFPINQNSVMGLDGIAAPALWTKDLEKRRAEFLVNFCMATIPEYIKNNLGGVLVLCTSNRIKKRIANCLRQEIQKYPNHYVYEQGEMPRVRLVKNFLNCQASPVLVATDSFREGFDAIGDKLTWVILDRLPYRNPNDKEMRKRIEILMRDGKISNKIKHINDLMHFSLIQSLGRLIRTSDDWGALTILDPRYYWLFEDGEADPYIVFSDDFRHELETAFSENPSLKQYDWVPRKVYENIKYKNSAEQRERLIEKKNKIITEISATLSNLESVQKNKSDKEKTLSEAEGEPGKTSSRELKRIKQDIEKARREQDRLTNRRDRLTRQEDRTETGIESLSADNIEKYRNKIKAKRKELPYYWNNMSSFIDTKLAPQEWIRIVKRAKEQDRVQGMREALLKQFRRN